MKNSEVIKLAWSMHRGQPFQHSKYPDYLCNIISYMSIEVVSIEQKTQCRQIITNSLEGSSTYDCLFVGQNPQYLTEDWEFYKHSEFYLTEKGKWVQSLINQLEKEEIQETALDLFGDAAPDGYMSIADATRSGM